MAVPNAPVMPLSSLISTSRAQWTLLGLHFLAMLTPWRVAFGQVTVDQSLTINQYVNDVLLGEGKWKQSRLAKNLRSNSWPRQ